MAQTVTAPSRLWVVQKQGTVVARFDTAGETEIAIPDSCQAIEVPDRSVLITKTVDTSVLTDDERQALGIPPE